MAENPEEENKTQPYPRIRIQAINKEAAQFFEAANNLDKKSPEARKLRRKGLDYLQQQAEAYVIDNNLDAERLTELRTSELVFLFSNLAKSKNPQITERGEHGMFRALWEGCDERIALAEEQKWLIPDKERAALMKYCRLAPKLIRYSDVGEDCWSSFIPYYEKWHAELEANRQPPKAEKRNATKLQQAVVNETAPEAEPDVLPRPKDYGAKMASGFKKIAPAYGIRCKRVDTKEDDFIRYDLYPWTRRENNQPTGSLTIHNEKEITLASQEYEHFVATAKMLKNAGHDEIVLQQLSKDPEEAKAFAANMVAAGDIVDVKVTQPYKLEELQKYNPRIGQIIRRQNPKTTCPIVPPSRER